MAGLLGPDVYHGKQLAPFTNSQPMLITSLLLNAAACHLRDPSACGDPALTPRNALHLAAAAIVLQQGYGKAFYRAACALGKLGSADWRNLGAAHATMRYAAQLQGCPAADLQSQLPPLKLPSGFHLPPFCHAMLRMLILLTEWAALMRQRAPAGQDFLAQLPGGLGPIPPVIACPSTCLADAAGRAASAFAAKERGNAAFASGDTAAALREYNSGIDHLRGLTFWHVQRHFDGRYEDAIMLCGADTRLGAAPAAVVATLQNSMALFASIVLHPYQRATWVEAVDAVAAGLQEVAANGMRYPPRLGAPAAGGDGTSALKSQTGRFLSQMVESYLEPYGGQTGPLMDVESWRPLLPLFMLPNEFVPY